MNVTIQCRLNNHFSETVYASMYEGDTTDSCKLLVSATLTYCIHAANERGYTITNAQDVLVWLSKNVDLGR